MGASFWILFILQIMIALGFYRQIFKVEAEAPAESITPATDEDVEVF